MVTAWQVFLETLIGMGSSWHIFWESCVPVNNTGSAPRGLYDQAHRLLPRDRRYLFPL